MNASSHAAAPGTVETAREAWQAMISDGGVLRPGHGIALRAARVQELGPDGELHVSVVEGSPGAELLGDAVTVRRVEAELSRRVGRPIRLRPVSEPKAAPPAEESAGRRQRLQQLIEEDPALGAAVKKLDLELLE